MLEHIAAGGRVAAGGRESGDGGYADLEIPRARFTSGDGRHGAVPPEPGEGHGKLTLMDAENGLVRAGGPHSRVRHRRALEGLTAEPPKPLVFLND